jgi:hypothetical protein
MLLYRKYKELQHSFQEFYYMQHEQTVLTVAPVTDHFAKFVFLRATNKHEPGGGSFLLVCHRVSRKS